MPSGCRHPPKQPLMGLRCPSESCRLSGPRSHRVLRCPPRSVDVSVRRSGSSPSAVPCRLAIDRLILSWACTPLQSVAELRVRLSPAGGKSAFLGVSLPLGDTSHRQLARGSQPPRFRPRRFSRPRRLLPPTALRVYFTPLPPLGYRSPGNSPPDKSGSPRRRAQPSCRCRRGTTPRLPARRHSSSTRLQGLLLPEVRCRCVDG